MHAFLPPKDTNRWNHVLKFDPCNCRTRSVCWPSTVRYRRPCMRALGRSIRSPNRRFAHLEQAAQGKHVTLGLVDAGGTICGHGFVLLLHEPKPVFGIGLHQDLHGQGWGRRLMQATLDEADAQRIPLVTLTVLKDNLRAKALYEKMGFSTKGEATFRLPDDCFYMERTRPTDPRAVLALPRRRRRPNRGNCDTPAATDQSKEHDESRGGASCWGSTYTRIGHITGPTPPAPGPRPTGKAF